jgi:hypothetical protein
MRTSLGRTWSAKESAGTPAIAQAMMTSLAASVDMTRHKPVTVLWKIVDDLGELAPRAL